MRRYPYKSHATLIRVFGIWSAILAGRGSPVTLNIGIRLIAAVLRSLLNVFATNYYLISHVSEAIVRERVSVL